MNFIHTTTKSGISLYVLPMPGAHSVASGVLVRVGSRDEKLPEEAGLAHAFEHMFFQGTKKFPTQKELSEYIEGVGGSYGAFTTKEMTFFWSHVPFKEADRGIEVLSEQLYHSLIPEEKIVSEIHIILQELNRAYDNPEKMSYEITWQNLFKNHPLGHITLGTKESLLNLKREQFLSFIERFYHTGNFTLIIAGNITPERAKEMCEEYFTEKSIKEENKRAVQKIQKTLDNPVIVKKKINQAHVSIAVAIEDATPQEKRILTLYGLMLGSGKASPLFQEIREKRGLCYAIFSNLYSGSAESVFRIGMATAKEKYQEAMQAVFLILENAKRDRKRLEETKKRSIGALSLHFNNPYDVIEGAAYGTLFYGKPQGLQEVTEAIRGITIQDIEKTVDKFLKPENFTTVLLMPDDL